MADHTANLLKRDDHQKLQNYPSLSQDFKFGCFQLQILSNTLEPVEQIIKPLEKHDSQGQGLHSSPIITTSTTSSTRTHPLYRGIRSRNGKWVSEIRVPRTKTRIWLGTYPTPEMAAAAYDAASLVVKGPDTLLNFPTHMYGNLLLLSTEPPTAAWIRVVAANAAASQTVQSKNSALQLDPLPQLAQYSTNYVSSNNTNVLGTKEEYVDEEELFDMPNLLMAMAEGMLISPPMITISTPPSDDFDEESLWSY
ncbi:Ethylene-responsive transcription factor [Heracleum sosnowskyi]|uniref:Ethylene-responsive transcription factor n=1 Tax=Heracleum sosnowskyi TaxID=360622 RepID=A0AAD8N870_9APIA|nr:Ethylene-responsive transcription factor [Heracleum sosnowskyi]